jgi:hypothetical protein
MKTVLITAALLFTYGFTVMLLDGPLKRFVPRCETVSFGFCLG